MFSTWGNQGATVSIIVNIVVSIAVSITITIITITIAINISLSITAITIIIITITTISLSIIIITTITIIIITTIIITIAIVVVWCCSASGRCADQPSRRPAVVDGIKRRCQRPVTGNCTDCSAPRRAQRQPRSHDCALGRRC